jgi:hypothetical protein
VWPYYVDEAESLSAEQARKRFIRAVFPLLPMKPPQHIVLPAAIGRCDRGPRDQEDLRYCRELLEAYMPEGPPKLENLDRLYYFDIKPSRLISPNKNLFSLEQWLAFLDSLAASKHEGIRLLGRYNRLRWDWMHRDDSKPASDLQSLLQRATALLADYRSLKGPPTKHELDSNLDTLFKLQQEIERATVAATPRPQRRELPVARAADPPRAVPMPAPAAPAPPAVHLKPLEMKVRHITGRVGPLPSLMWQSIGTAMSPMRVLACGNQLDVMWNENVLLGMRTPGLWEEWFLDQQARISDVQWDGEHLWVATLQRGIQIFDSAGKLVTSITQADGLLPCDQGLLLHLVQPGMVCAIGSFGPQSRAWCARIELTGKQVHLFHEATKVDAVLPGTRPPQPSKPVALESLARMPLFLRPSVEANGAEFGFKPTWTVEYNSSGDGRRLLLVGRSASSNGTTAYPLAIDLLTWKVTVDSLPLRGAVTHRNGNVALDGKLLTTSFGDPWIHEPQKGWRSAGRLGLRLGRPAVVVEQGDRAYLMAPVCSRFPLHDPSQQAFPLKMPINLPGWSHSAHFGVLGWSHPNRFYQVTIEDPPIAAATPMADAPAPAVEPELPRFELAEEDRLGVVRQIEAQLGQDALPSGPREVVYAIGRNSHDGWLPLIVGECWLDPPEKREGMRLHFADGLLVQIDELATGTVGYELRYDQQQRLQLLIRRGETHERPIQYVWVDYGPDGLIKRALKLGDDFRFISATLYEHAADGSQTTASFYLDDGRVFSRQIRTAKTVTHVIYNPQTGKVTRGSVPWRDPAENLLRYELKSHCPADAHQRADARSN